MRTAGAGLLERHRAFTFIMMPLGVYALFWVAPAGLFWGVAELLRVLELPTDKVPVLPIVHFTYCLVNYWVTFLVAIVFCSLAHRWAAQSAWAVTSCIIMALVGLLTFVTLELPTGSRNGGVYVGAGLDLNHLTLSSLEGLRFYLPILVLMFFYYYRSHSMRYNPRRLRRART